MSDLHHRTVSELSAALNAREVSSVELARNYLDRIERHQGELNAFISVTRETASTPSTRETSSPAQGPGAIGPGTGSKPSWASR